MKLHEEGCHVLIVGDRNHPEVQRVIGFVNENYTVVNTVQEAGQLKFYPKLGVIAQTTFSIKRFNAIISRLSGKANEARIFNTICDDTCVRPQSAVVPAGQTEGKIVVGGWNSAHTGKRMEICKSLQARTYHIEEMQEIADIEFENVHSVGITTGASTPDWIIHDVVERLKHLPIHSAV